MSCNRTTECMLKSSTNQSTVGTLLPLITERLQSQTDIWRSQTSFEQMEIKEVQSPWNKFHRTQKTLS